MEQQTATKKGRPFGSKKTVKYERIVFVRVTESMYRQLENRAKQQRQSLPSYLRIAFESLLQQQYTDLNHALTL